MEVFRLCKKEFASELSGIGASIAGGRWNRKGTEVIYTASSRALAMAEVLVHLPMNLIPDDFMITTVHVPDEVNIYKPLLTHLPADWNQYPISEQTQLFGDHIIQKHQAALIRMPSAVVYGDYNYIIDPLHPDFDKVKLIQVEPFKFDRRFFRIS